MKKIVVALLIAGALVGGLLLFRQPAPLIASPGDFLPSPTAERATLLLQVRDMAALGGALADRVQLLEDLLPPEEKFYLDAVTFKMREVAPHFGESLWLISFSGEEEIPDLTASFAVKAEEPRAFLEEMLGRVAEKFPELTLEPLEADLPEQALPLMRIQDPDSGATIFTALFASEETPVMLAATSRRGLRSMMEAFSDGQKRFTRTKEVEGPLFMGVSLPPEFLRELEGLPDTGVESGVPLRIQIAFDGDGSSLTGHVFSNAYQVMATPEEREALKPLGGEPPLVGEGTLIGLSSGRVSGLTVQDILAEIRETPGEEDVLEALEEMEERTGLTLGDVAALLNGRVSFVLGGAALTPFGEVPGAYLLLEPDEAGVAGRVALALLRALPFPLAPKKSSLPEWAEVYSLDAMATFTLAADEHRLLAGLLDAGQMDEKPTMPGGLEGLFASDAYGVLGLSFVELEKAVDGIARRVSLFLRDPRVNEGLEAFHEVVAPLDTLTMKATSPERGEFRLTYRERVHNEQEVQ